MHPLQFPSRVTGYFMYPPTTTTHTHKTHVRASFCHLCPMSCNRVFLAHLSAPPLSSPSRGRWPPRVAILTNAHPGGPGGGQGGNGSGTRLRKGGMGAGRGCERAERERDAAAKGRTGSGTRLRTGRVPPRATRHRAYLGPSLALSTFPTRRPSPSNHRRALMPPTANCRLIVRRRSDWKIEQNLP